MRQFDYISEYEEELILHCRRSILVGGSESIWQKKEGEFDVTMGSLDGAEISESVGLYLLHKLNDVGLSNSVGLYRDDGMAAIKGSRADVERVRKRFHAILKEEGLSITTEGGSKIVDFLDVVLNLNDGSYHPYVKPNTKTTYVSTLSNHPKVVIQRIQDGVCKRLSRNSSDAENFYNHSAHFDVALKEAGHPGNIKFEDRSEHKKKNRKRKVIWFNPPWCQSVRTNVAGTFLKLVRKHFGKGSALYHLFNDKKLKVSYSTGPNMKQLISSHNKRVIARAEGRQDGSYHHCDCEGGPNKCSLGGQCLRTELVYQATIQMEDESKMYIGQTKNNFKTRVGVHNSHTRCGRHNTALSTYLIEKKKKGEEPVSVQWEMIKPARKRSRGDRFCHLCVSEKVFILRGDPDFILNKRSEIMQPCRHKQDNMLNNFYSQRTDRQRELKRTRHRAILPVPQNIFPEEEGPIETGGPTVERRQEVEGGPTDEGQEEDERRPTTEEQTNQRWMRQRAEVDYKRFL